MDFQVRSALYGFLDPVIIRNRIDKVISKLRQKNNSALKKTVREHIGNIADYGNKPGLFFIHGK